jgi:hypothetical protein
MATPPAGSLAIALVEGQVSVVQGISWAISVRQEETDDVDLVLSISSDTPQEVDIIAFYPAGGFSFLADLKECPPIQIEDILCSLPSDIGYSEGAVLELSQEHYFNYLELKERNQQRLEEIYAKATQAGLCSLA